MNKKMNIQSLFKLIKTGSPVDSTEVSKEILKRSLTKNQIHGLVELLKTGKKLHNQIAASYALSWLFLENNNNALPFLIDNLNNKTLHPEVRAQCTEGIAYTSPDKRNKYHKLAMKTLMLNLKDSSPEVRFWCCFAIGQWRLKKAISALRHIKKNDTSICPGWWHVSEEAEDAIDIILGKETVTRIPVSQEVAFPKKTKHDSQRSIHLLISQYNEQRKKNRNISINTLLK